jgi:cytochrome P450
MQTLQQSPSDPDFVQNPYPFYAAARATGDLFHWDDYGMPMACTAASVNTILRDRRFGREPIDPLDIPNHLTDFYAVEAHSMLELEPPSHTRLRGLVLRAFTSRRIKALAPEIDTLAHQLIDQFPEGDFDLLPNFAQHLPVIIIARLLGVPEDMSDQLLKWSNAMVRMYISGRSRADEDAANQAAKDFTSFLRGYIDARRSKPADDLITHLIAAEEGGDRLSTDELITTCILTLNAGHEATVHTIGNGVKALLERGLNWPEDTDATVEEIMRFDPPLHMFTRYAYEEMEVLGHTFRPGDLVGLLLASANHDVKIWDAPEVFDPARAVRPHVAFGGGLHFCVGAPLARLELQRALPVLFERCPNLSLVKPPRYADNYHFHGLEQVMVRRTSTAPNCGLTPP